MATVTSLGMNIFTKFDGSGVIAAHRHISSLDNTLSNANRSFAAVGGRMNFVQTAALSLAPSLISVSAAATMVGASTASMATAAGSAAAAYGGVMKASIERTMEMRKESMALSGAQVEYINTLDRMKDAWTAFLDRHDPQVLSVARDIVDGLRGGIERLNPVIDAVHPVAKRVSEAFKEWMLGDGSARFAQGILDHGVPALEELRQVGVHVLAVLGEGFRTFLPLSTSVSMALLEGAQSLRAWSDSGGWQRFLKFSTDHAPLVWEFIQALTGALLQVSRALILLGPDLLIVTTSILNLIASMDPATIQAFFIAFMALRGIATIIGVVGYVVSIFTTLAALFSTVIPAALLVFKTVWINLSVIFATTPLGWLVLAIAAVVGAIILIATKTEWFQQLWAWIWPRVKAIAGEVWEWLKSAWSATIGFVLEYGAKLVAWFMSVWNPTWATIQSVAETVWNALKAGWEFLAKVFGEIYSGLIQPVIDAFKNVWPEVGQAAENVWKFITIVTKWAWSVITAMFEQAWSVLGPVVKVGWEIISTIFVTAFNMIKAVVETGWKVLVALFTVVWDVLSTVVKFGWDTIVAIFDVVWDILWAGVKAFGQVFLAIWSPIWTVVQAVFTGVWEVLKAAWAVFVNIIEAALLVFLAFFTGNWEKAWNAIKDVFVSIWNWITTSFEAFFNVIKAVGQAGMDFMKSLWDIGWNFIKSVVEAIWDGIRNYIAAGWEAIKALWTAALDFLKSVFEAVWNGLRDYITAWWDGVKSLFTTVLEFVKGVWNTAWSAISDFFRAVWEALRIFIGMWWENVTNTFNTFLTGIKDLWNAALNFLSTVWNAVWTTIRDFFVGLWNGLIAFMTESWGRIKSVFQSFVDWILSVFWNPIRDFFTVTLPNTIRDAVDAVGRFWDGLMEKFRAPVRWVINTVWNDGIVAGWNWINDLWGGDDVGRFNYATGGPVHGPGTGTSDSIAARLSNGEHVWTSREVAAAGGHGVVAALRSAVLGGKPVRAMSGNAAFAEGGGVGFFGGPAAIAGKIAGSVAPSLVAFGDFAKGVRETINGASGFAQHLVGMAKGMGTKALDEVVKWITKKMTPSGGTPMGWQQMWDIVRGAFPDSTMTSGLRQGDPGYHGSGNAIDVAYPMTAHGKGKMLELNRWIADHYPNSTELIHTPGINLKNGQPMNYSSETQAGHWDHVHWAMAGGQAFTGADGWRSLVMAELAHFGQSMSLTDIVLRRLQQESGGDARAINNWDINAQNGTPSKGLMQVIDPTFNAFKNTSAHPDDIWDPGANMHASMNYAMSRYGSLENAYNRSGGYMLGTKGALAGIHTVAENGAELITRGPTPVRFQGGEKVWNSKDTRELIGGGRGSGSVTVNIDARYSTVESVDKMKSELVPDLIRALKQGTKKR